jgi:DNA protecting protein DprA
MNYRLALFSAIEGGSPFWSEEISRKGVIRVYEELIGDFYQGKRNSAEKIASRLKSVDCEKLSEEILKAGGLFLSPEDETWPRALNDLVAPPIGLITTAPIRQSSSVAIVGTRNPTSYGARVASEFAAGFVDREWSVISGGAYGIDTSAHQGALAAEGFTIAVLASGISVNYPAGNERLFAQIRESGALISEVMPDVKARPERFLTRNRIIAALSQGTLVVEAAFRSGSLRTAREAASLYRTVMAIPGPITSPTSDGCHRLIQERCAEIVTSPADAIELMNPLTGTLSLNGS